MSQSKTLELAFEPEHWHVQLRDGSSIRVFAHAYCVEGDDVVFTVLFEGSPIVEVETLRLPLELMPVGFD